MPVPPLQEHGYPVAGRHSATLDELRGTFVDNGPNPWHRESLYRLLEVELRLLSGLPGTTRAWVGGDLISHAPSAGERVMVLGICQDPDALEKALRTSGVEERLTVLDAVFAHPFAGVARAVRPMGGMVDAYLACARTLPAWDRVFSAVPGDSSLRRGYLEVML